MDKEKQSSWIIKLETAKEVLRKNNISNIEDLPDRVVVDLANKIDYYLIRELDVDGNVIKSK